MRVRGWQRWIVGIAAACAAIVAIVALAFQPIARGIAGAAAHAMGYDLAYGSLAIHADRLDARNLVIRTTKGEPVATIASLDASYSIPDALRGARMYGLRSLDIEDPHVTLIRHRNGTWNVALPKRTQNAAPSPAPMIFDARITNGTVDVYDRAQGVPAARHLRIRGIAVSANVATNARTVYDARLTYEEAGTPYPIHGRGVIDTGAGYGTQRWTAAQLPIAHIVDVALNSPSMHIAGGSLRNLDARIAGLRGADGTLDEHVDATATLDRARIAIGGLRKPLRDVHGALAVYGDGLLLQRLDATIAGIPVRLGGGIYHLNDPQFRLTVAGAGDLHDLRTVLAQSSSLPVAGPARLNVLVEGRPSKPLILIGLDSPRVHYAQTFIDRPHGLIAFDGQEADVIELAARYSGTAMSVRGKAALHAEPNALEFVASLNAPPDAIPYAQAIAGGIPIRATVLASSDSLRQIDGRGIVDGSSRSGRIAGIFDVGGNGVGTVGPLRITRPGGASLYAAAFVDRPHERIDALLDAAKYRIALSHIGATLDGRIAGSYDRGTIAAGGWTQLRNVRTPYATIARADARFGRTPAHGLALALDASGIGALDAVASAMLSYNDGKIYVHDAAASLADTFVDAHGVISGVAKRSPRYDVAARMDSANLSSLAALVQPRAARVVEGSADATLAVAGTAAHPSIAGRVRAPEGAVNGLPFRALAADFAGTPADLAVRAGSVTVGTTGLSFDGAYAAGGGRMSVSAPHANLADFNDFFDRGDMLGGTGSIAASGAYRGGAIATSGVVALQNAELRNFALGSAFARWHTSGNAIDTALAFSGPNGTLRANGAVTPSGTLAGMTVRARNMAIGNWLAMSGFALPVTGIADADATLSGRFPNLSGTLSARARHGSVGRVPVDAFDLRARLAGEEATVDALAVRLPAARIDASGSFGLRANDPIALALDAATNDAGALARSVTGSAIDAGGSVRTKMTVRGTRLHPRVAAAFTGSQLRYGRFIVPHASGRVRADEKSIALAQTEIDLQRGRVLLDGTLPVSLPQRQIDPGNRPIAFALTADDVEASNFLALLPSGTHAGGRVDGRVTIGGTVHAPRFGGALDLAGGSYSGPQETVPVTNAGAQLAFAGTSATLRRAHAALGRGTVDIGGRASIPDIRDPKRLSMRVDARASGAQIDAPAYVKGTFDGDLHASKRPGERPMLTGTIAADSARIPLTALYNPKPANAPQVTPPDIGLGLHVVARRDVRVQSPNVDVGAEGFVNVDGSLAQPALSGTFVSTGGTVSFLRTFRIERGVVRFDPSSGIIPFVNAVATTYVSDPPTQVALRVHGPATALNVAFASQPAYDRAQILGLLVNAQSIGAVQGVAATGSGAPFSAASAVNGLAEGQLNELFTRNLLEPFDVAAGGALGLSNLQITSDLQSGFGVSAVKAFGKTTNLIYADTFNLPRRESLTLQAHPSAGTQYSLSVYNTEGESLMALQQPTALSALQAGFGNAATIPMDTGSNGIDLKVEKKFP